MTSDCVWRRVSLWDEEAVDGWACETHSTLDYSYFEIALWDEEPKEPCKGAALECLQADAPLLEVPQAGPQAAQGGEQGAGA